jgi:hypothetical protein
LLSNLRVNRKVVLVTPPVESKVSPIPGLGAYRVPGDSFGEIDNESLLGTESAGSRHNRIEKNPSSNKKGWSIIDAFLMLQLAIQRLRIGT